MKTNNVRIEKTLASFANMMIQRMESMKENKWQKGWIPPMVHTPVNCQGRSYSGINEVFLSFFSELEGFKLPIFVTLKQANKLGANVLKGAKSFPIIFWDAMAKSEDGNTITQKEYEQLGQDERQNYKKFFALKCYQVFNVSQTTLEEKNPKALEQAKALFDRKLPKSTRGMYTNKAFDDLVKKQSWVCPIHTDKEASGAFYSPASDLIVIPQKRQFRKSSTPEGVYTDGQEYYATMAHEMAHSTGAKSRLNRFKAQRTDDDYAVEELVAELAAALVGSRQGFEKRILDNNAAYLDFWCTRLKEKPAFILNVLQQADRAARMILDKVGQ